MSKSRLETFSDGVFAIAITLLVLSISQPSNYSDLSGGLLARWPSFAAYGVSFCVIGIMWLNHHSVFAQFARADRGLVYCNLALLLTISFLPYPTAIFGEALRQGRGQEVAAVVYSITMALNAYMWGLLWLYGSRRRRLLNEAFPEARRRPATMLYLVGTCAYTLSVGIAVINAYACLAFHALLALYFALDPLSRAASRSTASTEP
ncbi:MAG: TMEM175 family protein [Candidatus Dormibacteraeota bacterium]|nr:TMEM175 family protein [Candidatus Dormibacteraeota bacterium]